MPDSHISDLSSTTSRSASSSPLPGLDNEVTSLSNKLISAINHQTSLDDTLTATRQELDLARHRILQLEAQVEEHAKLLATGVLVRRTEVDDESGRLVARLAEEKQLRTVVEKDKKGIEQELENLTTALFEEANEMVAAARKEREAAERRNEQLRTQLKDMELLLASHQEQLAELKAVMQQMSAERDDHDTNTNASTAPSTPALASQGEISKVFDALHVSPLTAGVDDVVPAPPTSFSHLLSPVLRTDLQSYEDFRSLLAIPRKSQPSSRVNSGSYSGANALGLSTASPSNGSTASLSTNGTLNGSFNSSSGTPTSAGSSTTSPVMLLKETRFYKRALTEDIEPTLRLDAAPGISWLARRAVINSMSEGGLVVEPMPVSNKLQVFSCSLCGENRRGEEYARTHRFRTSENDNAQRYPLCNYCLNRVRASCDYLGFLRMVKDGHWRTDGPEAEKTAWEESVRLRERMFWARIGGGVVPAFLHIRESPRVSEDAAKLVMPFSAPPILNRGSGSTHAGGSSKENDDQFPSAEKLDPNDKPRERVSEESWEKARKAAIFDDTPPSPRTTFDLPSKQLQASLRESLRSKPRPNLKAQPLDEDGTAMSPPETSESGLSITIPGSFT
ncbi:MAG: rab guanine nucleotide exchange factor S2 [Icmadophila ericetorum]|nr:rab guanine nucleotide exchange factor S2 [Icmadophila ericetorum]